MAPATKQLSDLDKRHMKHGGLLNKHICEKKIQVSLTVNFRFSHNKSMGTLIYYSNQSYYPTRIKNTIYVEINVLSMYAKFQVHPPFLKRRFFFIYFKNLPFMSPQQPVK